MIFRSLFGGGNRGVPPSKLPQANSYVDAVVGGRSMRSVVVDSVGPKVISTREVLGRAGETAVLVYITPAGRFRASTKVAASSDDGTQFELPREVALLGAAGGAQKRQSVRLDALVNGQWRLAPGGKGIGEFTRGTIRDISRGGCSLSVDRALRNGTMVEIKMILSGTIPLFLLGEVMRLEEIKSSGRYSCGLRFHGVRSEEDQAIIDFINQKQAALRSRGLA